MSHVVNAVQILLVILIIHVLALGTDYLEWVLCKEHLA